MRNEQVGGGRRPAVVLGDLTLVRPLAWAGIPVVSVLTEKDDVTARSRYVRETCVVPGYTEAARAETANALMALGQRLADETGGKIPLFYGSDGHLALLFRYRRELAQTFLFLINDEVTGPALLDKEAFADLCTARGVSAPRTARVRPGVDFVSELRSLRAPLLVKPKRKTDWYDIHDGLFEGKGKARRFESAQELIDHPAFERFQDRLLVQELIEGTAADLLSFHGFADAQGELLASFCGRKVRTFPAFAGESALIELCEDPAVDAEGREVARRLGLVGPFKIDLIRAPGNQGLFTLEVNARFNLWDHLGAADGVNLLAIAYDYLVDGRRPVVTPQAHPRSRWQSLYRDVAALYAEPVLRPAAVLDWASALWRQPLVHETFDWRDPMPFAYWLAGFVRERTGRMTRWRAGV